MNNEALIPVIEGLEAKLRRLLKEYETLKKELMESMEENKSLRNQIEMQNAELKNFQNQEKITKIASSIAEDTQDNAELKLRINEYIKEIDKCIAYLNE